MPHPLKHELVIKVQTTRESAPVTALVGSLNELKRELTYLENEFKRAVDAYSGAGRGDAMI